jgi:hypothetical protein
MITFLVIGAPVLVVGFLWLVFKLEEKVSDESYL